MRKTFRKILSGVIATTILTMSLPNTANADIVKYYAKSDDKVYEYSVMDLVISLNGNGKVFADLMDKQVFSIYDDVSNSYIDFYELIYAVNSGKEVLKFAADYTGEGVEMPEMVISVTVDGNGEIKQEEKILVDKVSEELKVENIY